MNFDTFLGPVYVKNFFPFVAPVLDLLAAPDDILNTPNCHSYQCTSGNSDFVEGQVYTYDYDVTSITQMKSSPQDSSSLGIRSRAKIQVLSSCRFSLQVRKKRFCSFFWPRFILEKKSFSWTMSKLREMTRQRLMLLNCLDFPRNSSWNRVLFHKFVPTKRNLCGSPTLRKVYSPACNPQYLPPNWALTSLKFVFYLKILMQIYITLSLCRLMS